LLAAFCWIGSRAARSTRKTAKNALATSNAPHPQRHAKTKQSHAQAKRNHAQAGQKDADAGLTFCAFYRRLRAAFLVIAYFIGK
jgi:hypothetical protein